MNLLAEAEDSAKSPFLGQTEAEAEDSVDHWAGRYRPAVTM